MAKSRPWPVLISSRRGIVNCVAYEAGVRVGEVELGKIHETLQRPGTFIWIGLVEPAEWLLRTVQSQFGLHDLAVEDALKGHQRPKLERYDDSLFVVLRTVQLGRDTRRADLGETHIFVGAELRRHRPARLAGLARRPARALRGGPQLLAHGPAFVLYALMDFVVDQYFPMVDALEDELEELEHAIFSEQFNRRTMERIYRLKRDLLSMKRAVAPLIDMCNRLLRFDLELVHEETRPYFRDVYDHVVRINEMIDSLSQLVTTALEANLSLMSRCPERRHEAPCRLGRHHRRADDGGRAVRDELQQHARAELEVRLSGRPGLDGRHVPVAVLRVQANEVALETDMWQWGNEALGQYQRLS